jgi:hypothetical protein
MAKRSHKLSTKHPRRSKSSSRKTMRKTKRQSSRKNTLKKHTSKKRKSRTKSVRKRKKTKKVMKGGAGPPLPPPPPQQPLPELPDDLHKYMSYNYYHGEIDATQLPILLTNEGDFLVRADSSTGLVLSIKMSIGIQDVRIMIPKTSVNEYYYFFTDAVYGKSQKLNRLDTLIDHYITEQRGLIKGKSERYCKLLKAVMRT